MKRLLGVAAALFLFKVALRIKNMSEEEKEAIMGSANTSLESDGSDLKLTSKKRSLRSNSYWATLKPVKFVDIIGCDDAKEELKDIVSFLKNPSYLESLGGKVPRGVLITGPPGVGKTMLARAVATEAGVPFFYRSGSSFDEILVGVGSSRVKKLFEDARKIAPCVIFIDEIDAIGGNRKDGGSRQTLNQLLAEMDGFKDNKNIIVIGATNLDKVLDPALTRAGRFDLKVALRLPDAEARRKLVQHYLKRTKVDKKLDARKFATNLSGYSPVAIETLINHAALKAANDGEQCIKMKHLDWARNKQELGREKNKRGDVVDDLFELKRTAYHEAAHTIVAHYLKVPYRGVTIERRSNTLGHMRYELTEDFVNKELLESRLAVAVTGKLGEDALSPSSVENSHSTGCLSDYKYARGLATRLVTTYGFGSRLYPAIGSWDMSEKYKALIDQEVKALLNSAETKARNILKEHSEQHVKLSEKLLQNYKMTAEEMKQSLKETSVDGKSKS